MDLDQALSTLAIHPAAPLDLAELALALARDEYPALDVEASLNELQAMAQEARNYLRGDLAAKASGLARYLFHEMGFHGNTRNYYDPRNSYLNDVLDRRTGIPITLSVLAMAVAGRAGLEVAGVGLPGHFIAKAVGGGQEVLFDPFHGGRLLTPGDCEILVQQVTGREFQASPDSLQATPTGLILQRMLGNLKTVYMQTEDYARAIRVLGRLRQLAPDDPFLHRDLGACLFQTGRPGLAIDHLQTYLTAVPDGEDSPGIGQLLEQAKLEVAKWN